MADPTFAATVAMPQASLPVAGVVYNVNGFLGRSGIIGIKTGSTSAAGGCFVVAADATVGGRRVLVLGAVLGQGGSQELNAALTAGENLVNAARRILTTEQPLHPGAVAARLVAPWAPPVDLTLPSGPTFVGWQGLSGSSTLTPAPSLGRAVAAGQRVATLALSLGEQHQTLPLTTETAIAPPSLIWRLTRR
jgi:D-alanyl-D-alanine carboxypeptidase (penicillin-binding protein 5/6)